MNKDIMRAAGFGKQVDLVEQGKCPFCEKEIKGREDFNNHQSWNEFVISGMCQQCQDETFV